MNKIAVATELVKIAKELTASVRDITLEAWGYGASSPTIVEFTEQGYRVLQKGDGVAGYLHFPLIERKTKERIRTSIVIKQSRYPNECFAVVRSTDKILNGHIVDSTYGKRGDGKIGVTKSHVLPPHPDMDRKEKEYDDAVMAVLADDKDRTIDWSYIKEGVEFEDGGAPSSPPTEELRNVLIDYWHKGKRENAAGLGGPVTAWAFQGLSHADMETILREKIYLNR